MSLPEMLFSVVGTYGNDVYREGPGLWVFYDPHISNSSFAFET